MRNDAAEFPRSPSRDSPEDADHHFDSYSLLMTKGRESVADWKPKLRGYAAQRKWTGSGSALKLHWGKPVEGGRCNEFCPKCQQANIHACPRWANSAQNVGNCLLHFSVHTPCACGYHSQPQPAPPQGDRPDPPVASAAALRPH